MGARQKSVQRRGDDGKERRRFGRLRAAEIRTNLGRVLDFSGGGMRIESRWPLRVKRGARLSVRLFSEVGEAELQVRVSWVRSVGMLGQRAGLEFEELTPRLRAMLSYLAKTSAAHHESATGWVSR